MLNMFLHKVMGLSPALRLRAFERYLKAQGLSRSQVAIVIHAIKKEAQK